MNAPMLYPNDPATTAYIRGFFQRKKVAYSEEGLIRVLQDSSSSKMAVYNAVLGLRDVGTLMCVAALKAVLHYPMQDVKDCSILSIAHIAGVMETKYYVEALRDKKTRKAYPMWAIRDAADARAIDVVLDHVTTGLNKLRNGGDPGDAFAFAVEYLVKFRCYDPRIETLLCETKKHYEVPESQ
jgi:hypothetical protein